MMKFHAAKRTVLLVMAAAGPASAANGEMGTGVPSFGLYGAATGDQAIVWSLSGASIPFPTGCDYVTLKPQTLGSDAYKAAIATLLAARLSNRPVRLYSHAERDGGCGVDYVQLY